MSDDEKRKVRKKGFQGLLVWSPSTTMRFLSIYCFSGIAFPTCISVNNVICHYSPLISEPDTVLADGDVVKIDMGAHIDGYIAVVAHSFVVGESKDNPVGSWIMSQQGRFAEARNDGVCNFS